MSVRDDGLDDLRADARKRRQWIVTGAALIAVVGPGAYLIADRDDAAVTRGPAALEQVGTAAPSTSVSSMPAKAGPRATAPVNTRVAPTGHTKVAPPPASKPRTVAPTKARERIQAARSKAAADGHPLQRPLTPPPGVAATGLKSYTERTRNLGNGNILRIVSAKGNLSGQREMLWAADDGKSAGSSRCTQNFRFAANAEPAVRPTMLLCWRISDERSVVVLATAKSGNPSVEQSVQVLEAQWVRLG